MADQDTDTIAMEFLSSSASPLTGNSKWEDSELADLARAYSSLVAYSKEVLEAPLDDSKILQKIEAAILGKMEGNGMSAAAMAVELVELMADVPHLPKSAYRRAMDIFAGMGNVFSLLELRLSENLPEDLVGETELAKSRALENCARKGSVQALADAIINYRDSGHYDAVCEEVGPCLLEAMRKCADDGDEESLKSVLSYNLPDVFKEEASGLLGKMKKRGGKPAGKETVRPGSPYGGGANNYDDSKSFPGPRKSLPVSPKYRDTRVIPRCAKLKT